MADDVSNDIVVLIPGILGSRLRRGESPVWGVGHAALNLWRLTKKLTSDLAFTEDAYVPEVLVSGIDDGVRSAGLLQTTGIIPGIWRTDGYELISGFLGKRFAGRRVIEFPYDWRQSNRVTAHRFDREISPIIAAHRTIFPEARLQVIAHSMGGLVARYYAEALDKRRHTRRVITIGTPYLGAVKALTVLANGSAKLGPKTVRIGTLARSLPSVAELLPMYRCVGSDPSSLSRIKDDGVSIPGLPDKIRDHGVAFHAELQAAFAANGPEGPSYHPLIGHLQPTDVWASLDGDRVTAKRFDEFDRRGDGTVPRVSASPPDWRDDSFAAFFSGRHASFQESAEVWTQVHGILTSQPKRAFMSSADELAVDAAEWAEPGGAFNVTIESREADSGLQLDAVVRDGTGRDVAAATPQWNRAAGRYEAQLVIKAPGEYRYEVFSTNPGDGITPISDTVLCAATDGCDEDPDG